MTATDEAWMAEALAVGAAARATTSPNPWVGCVLVPDDGRPACQAATEPPGGAHAEIGALELAGEAARGATVYVTLEPCCHHGRTPPCTDSLISAGVRRVVVGTLDPDPQVAGGGVRRLREAGVEVSVGMLEKEVRECLAPYLKHRSSGLPWVVLKLAATLDGRIAAPDGSSRWVTGPIARADVHRLRAESDAIMVGAGTIRADDPALTARGGDGRDPLRVVLGQVSPGSRVQPALSYTDRPAAVLADLGRREVLQVLIEGGARVAHDFHQAGLIDRYVIYLAPALAGGDDGIPLFAGPGASTMSEVWRGRFVRVQRLGEDLRIDLAPGAGQPLP